MAQSSASQTLTSQRLLASSNAYVFKRHLLCNRRSCAGLSWLCSIAVSWSHPPSWSYRSILVTCSRRNAYSSNSSIEMLPSFHVLSVNRDMMTILRTQSGLLLANQIFNFPHHSAASSSQARYQCISECSKKQTHSRSRVVPSTSSTSNKAAAQVAVLLLQPTPAPQRRTDRPPTAMAAKRSCLTRIRRSMMRWATQNSRISRTTPTSMALLGRPARTKGTYLVDILSISKAMLCII